MKSDSVKLNPWLVGRGQLDSKTAWGPSLCCLVAKTTWPSFNHLYICLMLIYCNSTNKSGNSSVVEHRASDWKLADSWFDSRTSHSSSCSWEIHFTHISHRGKQPRLCLLRWTSQTIDLAKPPKVLRIVVVR